MSDLSVRLAGCIILDPQGRLLLMHRHTPERTQWEWARLRDYKSTPEVIEVDF
ncbi:MAG: hypothetical protein NUV80_03295 [Candidatus Berkelbacteria bacterium]|nr:hypothetical protein [Candidatus Berkelbacteria bacterium]MCR4307560.1 hypothetical protein [Candidatus Berkelbacteria bacterium]